MLLVFRLPVLFVSVVSVFRVSLQLPVLEVAVFVLFAVEVLGLWLLLGLGGLKTFTLSVPSERLWYLEKNLLRRVLQRRTLPWI